MRFAMLLFGRSILGISLLLVSADEIAAQTSASASSGREVGQPATQTNLVFKSTVRRVIVDVVVADSLGHPVSGLTAADFALLEDGKKQQLRSFDVHDFDSVSDSLPKLPTKLPANTFLNIPTGPERGPLYILLLDLLNIEVSDQPTARAQLLEFIRKKPEGTRFAIFLLTDRLYQLQGFTQDRDLLARAVDPDNPHSRIPKIFLYADNFRPYISTPGVLAKIGEYLADLSGRKNLIWFSSSFPSAILPTGDPGSEALSIDDQIKEATQTLARGRISVYPVDVRGAVPTSPAAGGASPVSNNSGMAADAMLNATYMTEDEIAHATGGRAFHDTNDLVSALTAATETGGRYYTLMYSPSNQSYDGKLRHIEVQLAKKGCRLEYRRSYFGTSDVAKMEPIRERKITGELTPIGLEKPSDSLSPNMQHGAPIAHQLLFRAHIHTVASAEKGGKGHGVELASQVEREQDKGSQAKGYRSGKSQTYQIDYTIAARYPLLEIAAAAYDDDGKILNSAIERVIEPGTQFPDSKTGGAIYRVEQKFDVPINAATVRVAVRDVATDNVGALEVKLPLAPESADATQ